LKKEGGAPHANEPTTQRVEKGSNSRHTIQLVCWAVILGVGTG